MLIRLITTTIAYSQLAERKLCMASFQKVGEDDVIGDLAIGLHLLGCIDIKEFRDFSALRCASFLGSSDSEACLVF